MNIGGITNETVINESNSLFAQDIGPGNCLIDQWIRMNSNMNYDEYGKIAMSGKINKKILKKALEKISAKIKGKILKKFVIIIKI